MMSNVQTFVIEMRVLKQKKLSIIIFFYDQIGIIAQGSA